MSSEGGLHGYRLTPSLAKIPGMKYLATSTQTPVITSFSDGLTRLVDPWPTEGSGPGERNGRIIHLHALTVVYNISMHASADQENRPMRCTIWNDTVAPRFVGPDVDLRNYAGNSGAVTLQTSATPAKKYDGRDGVEVLYDRYHNMTIKSGVLSGKYAERTVLGHVNFDWREYPIMIMFPGTGTDEPVGLLLSIAAWTTGIASDAGGTLGFTTAIYYTDTGPVNTRKRIIDRAPTRSLIPSNSYY